MKKVSVVIGANYGDEGKGRTVSALVRDAEHTANKTIVVRFNGGPQAGHTVMPPEPITTILPNRWVYHHLGSGTDAGVPTFLSEDFLVNPMMFRREAQPLREAGKLPTVFVDPNARVTTPYDIMLNQALERKRGGAKHGSCGLGIHETVRRSETHALTYEELFLEQSLDKFLAWVRKEWVPRRAQDLDIQIDPKLLNNENIIANYKTDTEFMLANTVALSWGRLRQFSHVIFEGAQGLLLDAHDPDHFPHVTPSRTGLSNVIRMLSSLQTKPEVLDVYYVTRSYLTRHGAGPMPHEYGQPAGSNVLDPTNIGNEFQGSLRFSDLDLPLMTKALQREMQELGHLPLRHCGVTLGLTKVRVNLVITCVDQLAGNMIQFVDDQGKRDMLKVGEFASLLLKQIPHFNKRALITTSPRALPLEEVSIIHSSPAET